jgi:hypothetical protein
MLDQSVGCQAAACAPDLARSIRPLLNYINRIAIGS